MFRPLRYGVGAYLPRIMVQGWGPFQQTGTGSHIAIDAGELAATIGAVISFSGIFFEPSLHMTFRIIFLAYLYWQLLGFTLTTLSNYMKCREEALLEKSESDSSDLVR